MADLYIARITGELPATFQALQLEARTEGYRHVDRLATDWQSGAERFDKPGEALFAAFLDHALVGIGGVTREPSDPSDDSLRARRFYVSPRYRRRGIGAALVDALTHHAFSSVSKVGVHAGPDAPHFWETHGFAPIDDNALTHIKARGAH